MPEITENSLLEEAEFRAKLKAESSTGEDRPRWEASRILPRHRAIINLALEGLSNKAIAERLQMSTVGVGLILRSEIVQDEMARRREKREREQDDLALSDIELAKQTLQQASLDAAEKLVEQIECLDPRVAQSACGKILEMAFGGELNSSLKHTNVQVISIEQLNLINQALVEVRKENSPSKVTSEDKTEIPSVLESR